MLVVEEGNEIKGTLNDCAEYPFVLLRLTHILSCVVTEDYIDMGEKCGNNRPFTIDTAAMGLPTGTYTAEFIGQESADFAAYGVSLWQTRLQVNPAPCPIQ